MTQTAFVVREPDVALTARLAELRPQFPGSELKARRMPAVNPVVGLGSGPGSQPAERLG